MSKILFWTIVLAWVGYFYSFFGSPLFYLLNPNGVRNYFWLSTFSHTIAPIRVSGFYDEPGAFSFFICLIVYLRTFLGLDIKLSLFLMLGGFVTQSAAHAIFFVIWLSSILFTRESKINLSIFYRILISLVVFLVLFLAFKFNTFSWAIERTSQWYDDPESAVRVRNFLNAYNRIEDNFNDFLYGFGFDCVNRDNCEGFSENILTPISVGGIFCSWPFYLFIGYCIFVPLLTFSNFSLIGIGLLLFQRPYFMELPYSFCLTIIITLLVNKKNNNSIINLKF